MGKGKSDWAIREKKADILFRLKNRLRNGQVCESWFTSIYQILLISPFEAWKFEKADIVLISAYFSKVHKP